MSPELCKHKQKNLWSSTHTFFPGVPFPGVLARKLYVTQFATLPTLETWAEIKACGATTNASQLSLPLHGVGSGNQGRVFLTGASLLPLKSQMLLSCRGHLCSPVEKSGGLILFLALERPNCATSWVCLHHAGVRTSFYCLVLRCQKGYYDWILK